jgi:hypothetical protein
MDTVGESVGKGDGAREGVGDSGVEVETAILGTLVAGKVVEMEGDVAT